MESIHKRECQHYLRFLVSNNVKHEVHYTNRTYKVISKYGDISFSDKVITKRGMGFIRRVGDYVVKNKIARNHPDMSANELGLQRYYFNTMQKGKFNNVCEIDLSKAYFVASYRLGVISKELFDTGMKLIHTKDVGKGINKIELLASLGSLAKSKRMRVFDGKKYGRSKPSNRGLDSRETRHLWNLISYEIDKMMVECMKSLGEDFLFYWTDAMFFIDTPYNRKKVECIFDGFGYDYKYVELEYVDMQRGLTEVWTSTPKNKNNKIQPNGLYKRIFCHDVCDFEKAMEQLEKIWN